MKLAEEKRLITDYKIHFKGRIPKSQWPGRYAGMFESALKIEDITFDMYAASCEGIFDSIFRQKSYKSRLIAQAHMLSSIAPRLLNKHANEQKWRLKIEQLVFDRFDQDITW
jgi:hypothetical protein